MVHMGGSGNAGQKEAIPRQRAIFRSRPLAHPRESARGPANPNRQMVGQEGMSIIPQMVHLFMVSSWKRVISTVLFARELIFRLRRPCRRRQPITATWPPESLADSDPVASYGRSRPHKHVSPQTRLSSKLPHAIQSQLTQCSLLAFITHCTIRSRFIAFSRFPVQPLLSSLS